MDGSVRGERQPDVLGLLIETSPLTGDEVQRPQVVALDEQLEREHAAGAQLARPTGELGPTLLGAQIGDPDRPSGVHTVQARPLAGLRLERIHLPGQSTGGNLGLDAAPVGHHADRALITARNKIDGGPDDSLQNRRGVLLFLQGPGQIGQRDRQVVVLRA